MKVSGLHIYPVKAMRGIDLTKASAEPRGLAGDRRWMLVDQDGRFITQREVPALATIVTELVDGGLNITLPDGSNFKVFAFDASGRRDVVVWKDGVNAALCDANSAEKLSAFLGREVQLVYMDEQALRLSSKDWVEGDKPVSFADGFPILLTSDGDLAALNEQLESMDADPVPMNRFRPNIVLEGVPSYEMDRWKSVQIGELVFDLVKPCTRCVVTTQDQKTGEGNSENQPIKALIQTRRSTDPRAKGVIFGWNLVPRSEGVVRVGDVAEVLEHRPEGTSG